MPGRQHAVNARSRGAPDRPARSPAGDAFSRVVIQVIRLGGLINAAGDALSRPAGQTTARWQVLAAAENAPVTVAQIARMLSLARQSVQRVADVLESEGLVDYDDNPDHLRAKLVRLTSSGRAALSVIQTAQRVWADDLGAEIGERDLKKASEVLEKMLTVLQSGRET